MKTIFLFFLAVTVNGFSQTPINSETDTHNCTAFPDERVLDYNVKHYQARVAMPLEQGCRIWIKGSIQYPWYKILKKSKQLMVSTRLNPPNYTAISIVEDGDIEVYFAHDENSFTSDDKIVVHAITKVDFERSDKAFAIAFYGCLEPFEIEKKTGKAQLNFGKDNANYKMRRLFQKVCNAEYIDIHKKFRKTNGEYGFDLGNTMTSVLLPPVRMIIGTGDQVYVDAGYINQKKQTDISTWEIKKRPMPLVDTKCYEDHVNRMYQHFGSFDSLNDVFHKLPSTAVWDDHEIRDGWGSQGDEYVHGVMNPSLEEYYFLSRKGYIDHHLILSSFEPNAYEEKKVVNKDLHQEFLVGGKRVFAFDLRSNRDINRNQVIDGVQFEAFKKWIGSSQKNEEIIILSSIPLFLGYRAGKINIANFLSPELRDDTRDGWDSKFNIIQRNEIIALILKHRIEDSIKPYIISGDVHTGGILEIWYNDVTGMNPSTCVDIERQQRKVLCYELIATGFNHETLNVNNPGFTYNFKSEQKKKAQKHWVNEALVPYLNIDKKVYRVSTISRIDRGSLNFGAIEFSHGVTNVHVFLHQSNDDACDQYIVEAEWDKKDIDDRNFMFIKKNTCKTFRYDAASPKEMNIISMKIF